MIDLNGSSGPSAQARTVSGRAALAGLLVVVLVAVLGYVLGVQHQTHGRVLTGRAYVGSGQANVRVDGQNYGVTFNENGLHWYDRHGGSHDGGVPSCLQQAGTHTWLTIGVSTAYGPHDDSWSDVTWVRCAQRP